MHIRGITIFSSILLLAVFSGVNGQQTREITLDDIYRSGKFNPAGLSGLNSMNDGIHYTIQNGKRIEKYSYHTGELVEVLFDAVDFGEIEAFSGYQFSSKEDKILIETGHESIYRHSYLAGYYVYDRGTKNIEPVSREGKQQLGAFSPDGSSVAFVRDNNLFIRHLDEPREKQVTFDGEKNHIINGAPDWVYEEEFGFSKGFHWSPDGRSIAFYRFDESRVKEFHMTLFGQLYPESYRFKYPKAGEENAVVTIHVYDLDSGLTVRMDTGKETNQYIPRIQWTAGTGILSIMRLNRLQNRLEILHADAVTGSAEVVYAEENDLYISEVSDNTITYLPDKESFILISEISGYFHLYHYNFETGQMDPITSGPFDIHEFLGYDQKRDRLFYTSYEESSIRRHVWSISLDGKKKERLSSREGVTEATFSKTFDYHILSHSSANRPATITLHDRKGKMIRVLEDNAELVRTMEEFGYAQKEFFTIPVPGAPELNAWMIKPRDFDPSKKYPLFIYVYGGPESQNVIDGWGRRDPWFQMLVQQGYIVACIDNRGTNGRGEAFRKATYMQLGKLETTDQVESARWLGNLDYIDRERIGIFGWSYGGYMTSLCMTKSEGLYRMGIAVAPVTNWRYYDTIYTERFMRTPQENPGGYDNNSPIFFAGALRGKFLLIHGSGDDNVHYQNTMDFAEALVQADRQFEMQIYPNRNHGIYGGNTSYHLYDRMTTYILENL